MAEHDIIVVGASAGGVEALTQLVAAFPENLPAAVFIVLHIPPEGTSVLPRILNRAGPLLAVHPIDGQAVQRGHIYIAPADQHMLLKPGYIHLTHGPRENGHRPAVDPLFRSAARAYGSRVIGVVLSGALDDGTAGLVAIHIRGGMCVVQDPNDALYSGMPQSAIDNVDVDYVVPIARMGETLFQFSQTPIPDKVETPLPKSELIAVEVDMAELDEHAMQEDEHPGKPSVYGCPECGGTLWEIQEGEVFRYRCRIGHAYSAQTLLSEQSEALEEALWVALRALEESASLASHMAERAAKRGSKRSEAQFSEQAKDARDRAEIVRQALKYGTLTLGGDKSIDKDGSSVKPDEDSL